MQSPPRIIRVTRRNSNNNRNSTRRNIVARRLFNNNRSRNSLSRQLFENNNGTNSGIRNNPHYVSMENTPERIVNQYTPRSRTRHNERMKRRGVIRRERYESELAEQKRALENAERRRVQALLRKGTPTKSEERESRKRPRPSNNY